MFVSLNFENTTNVEMCQENMWIVTDTTLIFPFKFEINFPLTVPGTTTIG